MRLVVVLLALTALAMAPSALASNASVQGRLVIVTGAPGEANVFSVRGDPARVRVTDGTARTLPAPRLAAGPGCAPDADDPFEILCEGDFSAVELHGGDGDDVFGASAGLRPALALSVFGGDGVDRKRLGRDGPDLLDGGPGPDYLRGGRGNDILVGGPGPDVLFGDDGNDVIDTRDGSADGVDCGAGRDVTRADRRDRTRGVVGDFACERGEIAQPGVADVFGAEVDRRGRLRAEFECVKAGCFGTLRVTAFFVEEFDARGRRRERRVRVRGEPLVQFRASQRSRRVRVRIPLRKRNLALYRNFRRQPEVAFQATVRDDLGRRRRAAFDTGL